LPPPIVSLPAPPSRVICASAATLPVTLITSLPPLALITIRSMVPASTENGAGSSRSIRTRVPFAVMLKTSVPLPPLISAVSMPAPPSNRSVSSPGFQIRRSSPPSPNIWSSASPPVSVSLPCPTEQEVAAAAAEQRVVARLAEELVVAGPARHHVVAGAPKEIGARQRAQRLVHGDDVVAALARRPDEAGVGDGRRAAEDWHRAAIHAQRAAGIAADLDGVVEPRRRA
jgi:hypothetical protein